jgi:hypothetical protein
MDRHSCGKGRESKDGVSKNKFIFVSESHVSHEFDYFFLLYASYLEAYNQASLTSEREEISNRNPETADIIDQFNMVKRGSSLVEKHQAERSKKVKKERKKEVSVSAPPEWTEAHPWKPWDREKDLVAGRKTVNLDKKSMGEGLSSRFSSSSTERSFL